MFISRTQRIQACNSIDYVDFLRNIPVKENTVILQDNAGIHNNDVVINYIENSGLCVLNNVPYSSDYNAVELFNYVKQKIKSKTWSLGEFNVKDLFISICNTTPASTIEAFVDSVYQSLGG